MSRVEPFSVHGQRSRVSRWRRTRARRHHSGTVGDARALTGPPIASAVQVAGIEHVCIGSDRDHRVITLSPEYVAQLKKEEGAQVVDDELPLFLEALNGPRRMEVIWAALEKRGYRTGDIERIMGANLYRLYRDVIG